MFNPQTLLYPQKTTRDFVVSLPQCYQGPLLLLPHFYISNIKWCAMHLIHLGCDLWLVGNALKTLLIDTEIWGSGEDDERLLNAWLEFKSWARQNKWQPLGLVQQRYLHLLPH